CRSGLSRVRHARPSGNRSRGRAVRLSATPGAMSRRGRVAWPTNRARANARASRRGPRKSTDEPRHRRLAHGGGGGVTTVERIETDAISVAPQVRREPAAALVERKNGVLSAVRYEHSRLAT